MSSYQSESQLEDALIQRLQGKGWEKVNLASEDDLWKNVQSQLGKHNNTTFSDAEFKRIRNHLEKGSLFEKAHILRDRFHLTRDDETSFYVEFFNTEHWCRNEYQVATQIGINGRRKNRYDVTLLVNGIPLCQIELKRRGIELKAAFDQINRYQKDSFTAAGGLFQYVQIFVISNGVNTRYYANNRHQSFAQTFTWADVDNKAINRLDAFTDLFLEKCHLSKMIAKYIVLHQSDRILMVLRSYQYYAAEKITERVQLGRENGYIWHATGSGKTLTSFKAAQNLMEIPKVKKILFVVDRADLDHQTVKEYNHFQPDSVDGTDDTKSLVKQFANPNVKLIVTTIQKLNNAISSTRHHKAMDALRKERVVFIFDECHRSQFGDAHKRIVDFFPAAQMFGFTGTPIFADNAVKRRTTKDLFSECLHKYVVTDAIRDENVLRFAVEYIQHTDEAAKEHRSKEFFEHPDRIATITDWVIQNHHKKSRGKQFGAIMCVGSVDALLQYYECFDAKRKAGEHDLKIASIFTYAANEEDPDADGLIPETHFPSDSTSSVSMLKRDRLVEIVNDYNALYGVKESVLDGKGFYNYYRAVANRVKFRDYKPFDPEQGVDILLVVNMFLTGFDAKTVNTLYVDKNLKYHGLIQAFSRTNRILNLEKSQGNIVCFRDLKEATDDAIALFANKNAREEIIVGSYDEHLAKFEAAAADLFTIVQTPDAVDDLPDENAQAAFVKAFRDLIRIRNVLATFSEFDETTLPVSPQDFEDFKSKYVDMAHRLSQTDEEQVPPAFDGIDFELELIRRDDINVSYIIALLTSMNLMEGEGDDGKKKVKQYRKQIFELLQSEVSLRGKRPYIEKFIDQRLPLLGAEDDIRQTFADFWSEERSQAFKDFEDEHGLKHLEFQALVSQMMFSGKQPLADEVMNALKDKPSILLRRKKVEAVISGINALVEVFDENIGEMDE
ncbi:type I restriction endonuclease subunit R [Roseobacter sp. HKCCA0882]|uniref:type I restriction endonuclease subunit R n=1 Tax=Roseobacter sp. HKCCA0882 TaxID=3120337 RepID=UPI0030ECC830